MSIQELSCLAAYFVQRGVSKIRLTGGEPLMRKDLGEIIDMMDKLRQHNSKLKRITMTTNGVTFAKKAQFLKSSGLDSVNISLDSLQADRLRRLTGYPVLKHVLCSIYTALELDYHPVKLNCVVMRGFNDDELCDFVQLTEALPIEVRFIEFMPFGGNQWNSKKLVSYLEMLSRIRSAYPELERVQAKTCNIAKLYRVKNWSGTIGFITSMTANFCADCTRLRLTADGRLKTCLHGYEEFDMLENLRKVKLSEEDVQSLFHASREGSIEGSLEMRNLVGEWDEIVDGALAQKAAAHAGMNTLAEGGNRPMIRIGG